MVSCGTSRTPSTRIALTTVSIDDGGTIAPHDRGDRTSKVNGRIPFRPSGHDGVAEDVSAFGTHAVCPLMATPFLDALENIEHVERLDLRNRSLAEVGEDERGEALALVVERLGREVISLYLEPLGRESLEGRRTRNALRLLDCARILASRARDAPAAGVHAQSLR